MSELKKIVFMTGTRADFGKLKSLINRLLDETNIDVHIFVTGMHMLTKYGYTCDEVEKCGYKNIYKYINQNHNDTMDTVLAKTISGFSDYVKEVKPDMIVVHGDRVEAMACAAVGSLNNILIAHIEGGEVSGTIDELIRHAVSKLSHLHFVANEQSKKRLIQLGEATNSIYVIGSPDIDIMASKKLPTIEQVKEHYNIDFDEYNILLYHPVTTEVDNLAGQCRNLVDALIASEKNFVVIYPNNDHGSDIILNEYLRFDGNEKFKVFPSMRFEYFLTLMKCSNSMVGNSSAGVREAPFYGVPTINLGSRQKNRSLADTIINTEFDYQEIIQALNDVGNLSASYVHEFGDGRSDQQFCDILKKDDVWNKCNQKYFIDLNTTVPLT